MTVNNLSGTIAGERGRIADLGKPYLNGYTNGNMKSDAQEHVNGFANGHTAGQECAHASPESTNQVNATQASMPIAICGLAMRLPGGIRDGSSFWDLLVGGKDARGPIPSDRYNARGFGDALGPKGAIRTQYGYFLDEDLGSLDTSFFTLSKTELEKADPQQRQLLEVTRECLENAGEVNFRGKPIGCYVGTFGEDWLQMSAKESQHTEGYVMTGHGDLMIANRVSYEYDLQGPSMVIKTGCSASLVGLHEACRALQHGDTSAAIVAGTNLIMGPTTTAAMTQEGILSPEGSCKTFDASADGFARGEAISAIYIKSVDQALKDGNPIRAIIRGTATNSDGRSAGLMTPNGHSHELLMRQVYRSAGLDPGDTAYVECHGTGTPTGDPIETSAVGKVFGKKGVYIGSVSAQENKVSLSWLIREVKPNVGHSEGASGITSLIKAVLALEHEMIPPNIKFCKPNPKICFDEYRLQVPVEATQWPVDRAKRISVNSFGIGGSNAHVILESAGAQASRNRLDEGHPQLLVFSANSQDSLRQLSDKYHDYIDCHPESLANVSYTLAQRRERLTHRCFAIAGGGNETTSAFIKSPTNEPDIIMVFSGQGAQWPQMARELIESNEGFHQDILEMDRVLKALTHSPYWTIEGEDVYNILAYVLEQHAHTSIAELQKPAATSQLNRAELAQPVCTAIQIALVNEFHRCGIRPKAVIGHSSGEIAAAYASGALTVQAAMIIAYYRGFATKKQSLQGGMAAIGLASSTTLAFLEDGVVIACENSPQSTTISGDLDMVTKVVAKVKAENPDILARPLKVDMAYHSHHMKPVGSFYRALMNEEFRVRGIKLQEQTLPLFSSVTDSKIEEADVLGIDYWVANLQSPVLFSRAASNVRRNFSNGLFLKIGPHSTLSGPLRQICSDAGSTSLYVPAMLRSQDTQESFLSALGHLYQYNAPVNFQHLIPHGRVLTDLPAYPWEHSVSYWYENRISKDWRFREFGHHGILGVKVPESTSIQPSWRNVLLLEDQPWIYDHKIRADVVFPFAGYIAMAGEAISAGYHLKHTVAHTALVLTDSKPVEMITTLRPHRLTDSADSDAYDFTIISYSGASWIKHCEGIVRPVNDGTTYARLSHDLTRRVAKSRWYDSMADIGIVYGPEFQGLSDITASTTEQVAAGKISVTHSQREAAFLFHPTAIDASLQLLLVAIAKGIGRDFGQLSVPTLMEELLITSSAPEMDALAWKYASHKDIGVECRVGDRVALRLRGIHLTPLEDETLSSDNDRHAAARMEWRPHFDFADIAPLFKTPLTDEQETYQQEEMTLLCMVDTAERIRGLEPSQPHFRKFRKWLDMEIHRAEIGTYPLLKDAAKLISLPKTIRCQIIKERFTELSSRSRKAAVAEGIMRIHNNAEDIFTGRAVTLDILMRDDVLTEFYDVVSFGHGDFVRLLSHTRPNIRILEVGAGTGGTTELLLRDLVTADGFPAYSVYTFTDISAGFFPQAKERCAYASNMEYKVFDISQSPANQGFDAATYDLILAANVVHATPSLFEALSNLRSLLRPNGHLVLTELCAVARTPNYIFGNFSGWWLGEADDRPYEPYISVARWDHELKAAGFYGVGTAVVDAQEPFQYCAAIVAQPRLESFPKSLAVRYPITLLCESPQGPLYRRLVDAFGNTNYEVTICHFGKEHPRPGQDIVSMLDLEEPFFEAISGTRFAAFQDIIRNIKSQKLLWLTKPAQVDCHDARSALSIGNHKVGAIPFFTLEIDHTEAVFSSLVHRVFEKIRASEDTENLLPDREYAVDKGIIKVGRYHPFSLTQELSRDGSNNSGRPKTLEIGKPGLLQTLQWVEDASRSPLPGDHVEIETRAIGLNFRDIVFAIGIISSGSKKVDLGLETAGFVKSIGDRVKGLAIGDRVFALAPHGCITTHSVLPSQLCVKIPDTMSFEQAATMPICFATAIEALIDVGQLEKGQTVLVHSACGGVGHAAVQICKMLGAEIFATVGSEEKVQYLIDKAGIPRDHIFNSRDASFATDLKKVTGGRGVDLVLNSLSGELLHASWASVAEFGKLVELGKRDLAGFGKLDMEPFLRNRSYCCVDIAHLTQDKPGRMSRVLDRCLEMYRQGYVHPIAPVAFFEASEIEQSFRYLQKGDHIGKVVIRMPDNTEAIPSTPRAATLTLDADASYLLTGGLGGLGKSVALWMVQHGARSLVFLSRSAGASEDDEAFFAELRSLGCSISAVAGKAQDMVDIENAIKSAPKPIKGVVHLAMVLRDSPIVDMSYEQWNEALAPKVDGAWNLHKAFLSRPSLDFLILASSLVTIVDQPGQGNYQAANTYLEAFCQYRRNMNLPASVLNICPIEDVGFVAENPVARKNLKSQGLYFLRERDFLDYLDLSIRVSHPSAPAASENPSAAWKNPAQLIMGLRSEQHLSSPNNRTNWRRDRRMAMYHNVHESSTSASASASSSSPLQTFLARAEEDLDVLHSEQSAEFLAHAIGQKIFDFMLKPEEEVDVGLSLTQIGLDSLMAIELRRWWKQVFRVEVSVLEIMGVGSLRALGKKAAEGVEGRLTRVE